MRCPCLVPEHINSPISSLDCLIMQIFLYPPACKITVSNLFFPLLSLLLSLHHAGHSNEIGIGERVWFAVIEVGSHWQSVLSGSYKRSQMPSSGSPLSSPRWLSSLPDASQVFLRLSNQHIHQGAQPSLQQSLYLVTAPPGTVNYPPPSLQMKTFSNKAAQRQWNNAHLHIHWVPCFLCSWIMYLAASNKEMQFFV